MSYPGRLPPGRAKTFAFFDHKPDDSWYPTNPLASPVPGSAPGSLHHSQSCPEPISTPLRRGRLTVSIFEARNIKGDKLRNYDTRLQPEWRTLTQKSNWVANTGGVEDQTTAHKNAGSNPEWNQQFTFYVLKEHPEYNNLKISLYNRNRFRHDEFLGHLTIFNLGDVMSGRQNMALETWYPVIFNGVKRGEILLSFDMKPMSAQVMLESKAVRSGKPLKSGRSESSGATGRCDISFSDNMTCAQVILAGASVVIALIALI